ncbi:hypothetical protein C9374_011704 [Naegleria lovaniensis]|uniref:Phosphatidic acid phosphatase type 2/haloperoxidase domain-containing protein n=1 Tax=Naegleria lovaniensis TaxID=51637 RepID=A0AA88KEM6_NAELO|nr:uncharacterized protein C9374_011704 [Naegleria lovaniensis]KAG2373819.1 hypothetical protein C9374_011704 [Naegleria lovaniensis]
MQQPSSTEEPISPSSSSPSTLTISSSSPSVTIKSSQISSSETLNSTPKLSNTHQEPTISSSLDSSTENQNSKSVHHPSTSFFIMNDQLLEKNKELVVTTTNQEEEQGSLIISSQQDFSSSSLQEEVTTTTTTRISITSSEEHPTQNNNSKTVLSEPRGSSQLPKENSIFTHTTTSGTTISTTSSSSELRKRKKNLERSLLDRNIIMYSSGNRGDGYLNSPHNRSSSSLDGVFDVITDYYYNGEKNTEENGLHEDHEQHHLLNASEQGGFSLEDGKIENMETIMTSEDTTQQALDSKSDTHSIEEENHEKATLVKQETSSLEETSTTIIVGDYEKFVYRISPKFENYFKTFDDKIIATIQFKPNIVFFILSMIVTAMTTIEIGILAPVVLYILGIDHFASYTMWIILTLSMLSQLPKRFMFRVRPYLASRAKCIAKDKTSSFPSRAVTCSVVYAFLVCYFIRCVTSGESMSDVIFWIWCIPCCFFSVIAASAARIYLGVHYPSDCLFGALQGLLSIILGTICYMIHLSICTTCAGNSDSTIYWNGLMPCYASLEESVNLITEVGRSNLSHVNWYLFCILSIGSLLVGILFVIKPIQFYTKFHHVFSMLAPCLTFQYCFLCPTLSLNGVATIPKPSLFPPWFSYLYATIVGIVFTAAGMKSPKKYSLIAFPILYILVFCALFFWRSCIFQQSS